MIEIIEIVEFVELLFKTAIFLLLGIISLIDIKKKIIEDKYLVILFCLGFFHSIINKNIDEYYIGMCIYHMPLLTLYIIEDLFNRELIGFGDIKLMIVLGGLIQSYKMKTVIGNVNLIEEVTSFYYYLYAIAGLFSLLLLIIIRIYNKIRNTNHKIQYLPFAPFIAMTYILITR